MDCYGQSESPARGGWLRALRAAGWGRREALRSPHPAPSAPPSPASGGGMEQAAQQCVNLSGARAGHAQWEQMPVISITRARGVKPTARAAACRVSETAGDDASPTAPQRSQMRNRVLAD